MYERTERAIEIIRSEEYRLISSNIELWEIHGHYTTYNPQDDTYDCNCEDHDPEKGNIPFCKHIQVLWLIKHCE